MVLIKLGLNSFRLHILSRNKAKLSLKNRHHFFPPNKTISENFKVRFNYNIVLHISRFNWFKFQFKP